MDRPRRDSAADHPFDPGDRSDSSAGRQSGPSSGRQSAPSADRRPATGNGSTRAGSRSGRSSRRSPAGDPAGRRAVLRRAAAAVCGTVALSGCTEDVGEEFPPNEHWPIVEAVPELPVRRRGERLADRIEELAAAPIDDLDGFLAELEARSVPFEAVSEVADQLHLEYAVADPEREGILEVVGPVAGAYASLVDGGFEARALELVAFEADGATFGSVEVSTAWAEAYLAGRLTAGEYGELVAGTIESAREPPEPDVAPEE